LRLMILVSACLLGVNCRYDGGNCRDRDVIQFLKEQNERFIPICPEQLGGLPTPREPSKLPEGGEEVIAGQGNVTMKDKGDVTSNFLKGAEEASKLAESFDVDRAILKEGSPSCGVRKFAKNYEDKGKGSGVTAALLIEKGLDVISEKDI